MGKIQGGFYDYIIKSELGPMGYPKGRFADEKVLTESLWEYIQGLLKVYSKRISGTIGLLEGTKCNPDWKISIFVMISSFLFRNEGLRFYTINVDKIKKIFFYGFLVDKHPSIIDDPLENFSEIFLTEYGLFNIKGKWII